MRSAPKIQIILLLFLASCTGVEDNNILCFIDVNSGLIKIDDERFRISTIEVYQPAQSGIRNYFYQIERKSLSTEYLFTKDDQKLLDSLIERGTPLVIEVNAIEKEQTLPKVPLQYYHLFDSTDRRKKIVLHPEFKQLNKAYRTMIVQKQITNPLTICKIPVAIPGEFT